MEQDSINKIYMESERKVQAEMELTRFKAFQVATRKKLASSWTQNGLDNIQVSDEGAYIRSLEHAIFDLLNKTEDE